MDVRRQQVFYAFLNNTCCKFNLVIGRTHQTTDGFFVGPEMAVRQRWDGLFPLNIREAQWKAPAGAEILLKKSQQLCYDWTVKSM